jgi:NAD+ diphosphatase
MPSFTPRLSPVTDHGFAGRWYLVRRGEVLVGRDGGIPQHDPAGDQLVGGVSWPQHPDADGGPVFLGDLDGEPCWALGVGPDVDPGPGFVWTPLMSLATTWDAGEWTVAGRAVQLVEWQRTSRFCGRCGTVSVPSPGERGTLCPQCGLVAYPRLAPAVIMLVRRGETALLARNRRFPGGMYSALAGFVEAGETLEQAVRREVLEEVGITVGPPRYLGSQSWPFPHQLMVAFLADWVEGEIEVDGDEIVDAEWFRAESLPSLPGPVSIARALIDHWLAEVGHPSPGSS